MNTLILFGSPRPRGGTAALVDAMLETLPGEAWVADPWKLDIRPCVDCRACEGAFRCAIRDDMDRVYDMIHRSDSIVVASPVWYSGLTAPMIALLSRLQPGFHARRRGEAGFADRVRRGGILLTGGGSGAPDGALMAARMALGTLNAREIAPPVTSLRTDSLPAREDTQALEAARGLGRWLGAKGRQIE